VNADADKDEANQQGDDRHHRRRRGRADEGGGGQNHAITTKPENVVKVNPVLDERLVARFLRELQRGLARDGTSART
jgi:hypothetical protein